MDQAQLQQEVGRRVRRRRMALGMLQKTLAEQTGIPQGHLSRLEKGEFQSLAFGRLVALADTLHTSLDYLLARSNEAGEVPEREPAGVALVSA